MAKRQNFIVGSTNPVTESLTDVQLDSAFEQYEILTADKLDGVFNAVSDYSNDSSNEIANAIKSITGSDPTGNSENELADALQQMRNEILTSSLTFVGYIATTAPDSNTYELKEDNLWINYATMPTSFPIAANLIKKWDGSAWVNYGDTYTPNDFEAFRNLNDGQGYYWFGGQWVVMSTDLSTDYFYLNPNTGKWEISSTYNNTLVHKTGNEQIGGKKTFSDEITGRWRAASCHTNDNYATQKWFKLGQFKSYGTFNTHILIFKLWVGTQDYAGVASGRVVTRSGGAGTAGLNSSCQIQFNYNLDWLTLTNFKILYKENQSDADGTYVLYELWAQTFGNYTGYTMSVEDERAGGEMYSVLWTLYTNPTGVASLPAGYTQVNSRLARDFALDNAVVHLDGTETIPGAKTFTNTTTFTNTIYRNFSSQYPTGISQKNTLIPNNYSSPANEVTVVVNGLIANDGTFVAYEQMGKTALGVTSASLNVRNRASSSSPNRNASIGVSIDSTGNITTYAPASDTNGSIVTTYSKSRAQNGFYKLGNGLIIQWGVIPSEAANTHASVSLPTAFSTTNYSVFIGFTTSVSNGYGVYSYDYETTKFKYNTQTYAPIGNNSEKRWIAIGY